MEEIVSKKDITDNSNANKKEKIKVKRSRRRMYESVQDDEKPTVASKEEKKKGKKNNDQDLFNEKIEAEENRLLQANEIVAYHVQWSLGVGLIPFPLIDAVTVLIIQAKMLKKNV